MEALPAEPRAPWASRILVVALWLSWAVQLLWLLERVPRFLEESGYFLNKGGIFALFSIVLRAWLNWQFCRRRRWARLSLLWLHVFFACLGVWMLQDVISHVVFYPCGTIEYLFVLICICAFLAYLLARKDGALWCRAEVSSNRSVASEQHSPGRPD